MKGLLEQLIERIDALEAEVRDLRAERRPDVEVPISEYAKARSINPATVRAAIKCGRLPAKRYGNAWRVPANAELGEPVRDRNRHGESRDDFADRVLRTKGVR